MDVDDFCRARGIDLASVAVSVEEAVGLGPGDRLTAVGSLAEGLGNSKSDLDLFLVTDRDVPPGETALLVANTIVDARLLSEATVTELLGRLDRWSSQPWDVTHAASFSVEERIVLHRLCNGRLLWSEETADDGLLALRREHLARLRLHGARHVARSIQVDLQGYVEDGEYRGLVFAAQDLLGHAADALLAGYGKTNPLPKWRSTLLGSLPAGWEEALEARPTGLSAPDRFWELHRAPREAASDQCLEHALRISSFARAVFVWAERTPCFPSALAGSSHGPLAIGEPPRQGPAMPYLDFDVDFALHEDVATLGRLNDFGETLALPPAEFHVALRCDGITTPSEAAWLCCGGDESAAHDTIARLTRARLVRDRIQAATTS